MRSSASRTATGSADRSTASSTAGRERRRSTIGASVAPRYAEAMARIRVAMAQLNTVVGDLDGNVSRDPRRARRGRGRRVPTCSSSPSWPSPATRPRTSCSSPASWPTTGPRSTRSRPAPGRCAAVVGFVDAGPRPAQRGRGLRARRGARHLPQAPPAELRRVRRARYFVPGDEPLQLYVIAGVRVGVSICEDAWSPTGPDRRAGRRRRRAGRQHQRVAVLRRACRRARADARDPGRRRVVRARLREPGRRPGRARLRRRVARVRRRRRARRPGTAVRRGGQRRRPRRRAGVSASACSTLAAGSTAIRCPRSSSSQRVRRAATIARLRRSRRFRTATTRCTRRSSSAPRDYVTQERLHRRRHRPLRRHRLVARRVHRRRRARPRARPRRLDAVALLERRLAHRRRGARRRTSASTSGRSPIEPAHAAFLEMLAPSFGDRAARPHRGEPAEPDPRRRS